MRLLVVNFFPAFHPPRSGGEQRYYYLYEHLSRHFDVTLLSPTYSHHAPEVVTYSPTFREHRVPKDFVFDRLHGRLDAEGIGPECSAYVVALAGGVETAFGRRFQDLVVHHDVVIHESPFTLPYDRTFGEDGKPRVYNSYNVEYRLAAQILRGPAGRQGTEFIRFLEASLAGAASLVMATCEDERQAFVEVFGVAPERTLVAPNGFEPAANATTDVGRASGERPFALFMGSAHPPNVEAARFLVAEVAPAVPGLDFRILGAVCEHLPATLPPNVHPLGFVPDAEKHHHLAGCTAALNPLFSGAGTNLKMLDYMAAGAPIVATTIGARGLALADGQDVVLAERGDFATRLRDVAAAPERARALGARARRKAFAEYTWAQIAQRVRHALLTMRARRDAHPPGPERARLLVVNDFPVSHATSGGQVRIRALLAELGKELDVVLLCFTGKERRYERRVDGAFTEIGIPKTTPHRAAEAVARGQSPISVDDLIAADCCIENPDLVSTFHALAARAATVVFEHPYLAPLAELLPTTMPVVYSALNVERDLKAVTLAPRPDAADRIARVAALESAILARADLVVCVSAEDRARFARTHPGRRYAVVESGAHLAPAEPRAAGFDGALGGRPLALFLGSGHPPNVAAARFIVEVLAPAIPDVAFGIIGSVCDTVRFDGAAPNVLRLGVVTDLEKTVLLSRADLGVNPLFDGGGSSLKVPDFLGAGLPLVSTRVGVRGFDLVDGEHFVAADRDDFVAATRALIADLALRRRLGAAARAFCEATLDWRILGARYRRVLRPLIAPEAGPRALVVTYRFADPPPGGAEAFLVNVLREIARRGALQVDVAAADASTITTLWNFSARYGPPDPARRDPDWIGPPRRFPVEPPRMDDLSRCARLFVVWMTEARRQALELLPLFDRPLLLGGWNYPETYGGTLARWASREAQVFVGDGATALRLIVVPPQTTRVEIVRGGAVVASRVVGERVDWQVDLPGADPVVVVRVGQAFVGREDPRELGVLVLSVSVRTGGSWCAVDLADDFEAEGRRRFPERWVRSLVGIAAGRDAADDDLFTQVRGPRSPGLVRWLEDHMAGYDVVLVQGVPFSTPADVASVAARFRVPLVVLPHFHMEDRYYHWRRYYDVFRQAHTVIASSPAVKALVFDAIGAHAVALPGGGVDLAEYDPDARHARVTAFRALHPSPTPFLLVLGRKAGSKHYRIAIEALTIVNRDRHRADLVLIGPDEDEAPIDTPHVFYYGRQPRDVVLGALASALCLVNMSESESFGIVLLESWLSDRPVVARRRCMAFADLVVPDENGHLAETPVEVARAVESYLASPALAARHAARGRDLAVEHAWAHLAERVERILREAALPATHVEENARDRHV